MTLEKAIEILTYYHTHQGACSDEDNEAAVKLGIEALKFLNTMGECPYCHVGFTLPGETKE